VGNSTAKFRDLDRYVCERLAKFLAKKGGEAGINESAIHACASRSWGFIN
jgi:hypothetical protein